MLNKNKVSLVFIALLMHVFTHVSWGIDVSTTREAIKIIPEPVSVRAINTALDFRNITHIVPSRPIEKDPTLDFRHWLILQWDIELPIRGGKSNNTIRLEYVDTLSHKDGYRLSIGKNNIDIFYKDEVGAFYAFQSLKQLFPVERKDEKHKNEPILIPGADIFDYPRFSYRGMHLDECRHFFGVEAVKKYIDMLAFQKMNYFHWHLTDDQGWRIEIKKYPKLQEIASCRNETLIGHYSDQPVRYDGRKYCFYYTQEQAKEIVKYAAERFITVIPEIEMPGHATAAVAAYPELGCTGKQITPSTTWGVFEDIFCPNEVTFTFLEDVLTEIMDIFPSKLIHIGGDEAPKDQWKKNAYCQALIKKEKLKDEHELQSYFIKRIEKFVNSKGREIIGWDEILEGGLAPNAKVMSWRGFEGGLEAAMQNHEVVMTPTSFCYFDYYQSREPGEPISIGGYVPLKKVYSFEPIPANLPKEKHRYILGAQANIWTEYIKSVEHMQYMAYPRSFALAEVVWSPIQNKDYDRFLDKLSFQLQRLDVWGIQYAKKLYNINTTGSLNASGQYEVIINTDAKDLLLQYKLNKGKTTMNWQNYDKPLYIDTDAIIESRLFDLNTTSVWGTSTKEFVFHKALGRQIQLISEPSSHYNLGGKAALVNGIRGEENSYGGMEWLGFSGKDFECVIDLSEVQQINGVDIRFFNSPGQWIYPPKYVELLGSNDNVTFKSMDKISSFDPASKLIYVSLAGNKQSFRYVKLKAKKHGIIESGKQGSGNETWLFVDEIIVR